MTTTATTITARVAARFLLAKRDVVLHPLTGLEVRVDAVAASRSQDIVVIDGHTGEEDVTFVLEGFGAFITLAPEPA